MGFVSGLKRLGRVAQKTYAPSNDMQYRKMAEKEAKHELDINTAVNVYGHKIGGDKKKMKAFEKKLRMEAVKPKKPIFENADQAFKKFDSAFGGMKSSLPDNIRSPKGFKEKYKRPTSLEDPFGKPF